MTGATKRNRLRANRLSGNGYSAQGSNFGIGLIAAGTNENVIEENTVAGNTNGIFLAPGAENNIVRRNLVTGNPAVQVSAENASESGVDIRNLSGSSTNTFQANVCLTSLNAPCPGLAASLTASPNPIPVTSSVFLGMTTISWIAPRVDAIEIRLDSPDGKLFAAGGERGSAP
ncbi:MAG: right-handed parallel beta-helix repeat-containing protein, partial [Gammaproteobacteria bacterium]